jgi:phosphoglycerate kinase
MCVRDFEALSNRFMPVSTERVRDWCCRLIDPPTSSADLECLVAKIPRLPSLADLPVGTPVLVRCDTNVPMEHGRATGSESRLRSLTETLSFGRERGWRQIIHGHLGVDGQESLAPIAARVAELLESPVLLVTDWMDDESGEVRSSVGDQIRTSPPSSLIMLENARRYRLETCLWRPRPQSIDALLPRVVRYVNSVRDHLARIHVNEAFAASNCDLSSALVPLAMNRVALACHSARELDGPVAAVRQAEVVIFSGAKFNKLNDLARVVDRGQVKLILAGGLLALPLLQAHGEWNGTPFEIGRFEEVPPACCTQAEKLLVQIRERNIELLLPIDFVLEDGSVVEGIPAGMAHRDIGPRTRELFHRRLLAYAHDKPGAVLFHNGVVGQFERPEFAAGTKRLMQTLADVCGAGMRVFVGGGEGGTALERFGHSEDVTHCFTAGTTILKALGTEPIPYLWALSQAAGRIARGEGRDAL